MASKYAPMTDSARNVGLMQVDLAKCASRIALHTRLGVRSQISLLLLTVDIPEPKK